MNHLPTRPPRTVTEFIREGNFAAEVTVQHHYDSDWSPTLDMFDIEKLERVRLALRRGDIEAAAKEAKVYELMPLAGE